MPTDKDEAILYIAFAKLISGEKCKLVDAKKVVADYMKGEVADEAEEAEESAGGNGE